MDLVDTMMTFEQGELSDEDTVEFFQELINSGVVWSLQGTYGRFAISLIDQGYCVWA